MLPEEKNITEALFSRIKECLFAHFRKNNSKPLDDQTRKEIIQQSFQFLTVLILVRELNHFTEILHNLRNVNNINYFRNTFLETIKKFPTLFDNLDIDSFFSLNIFEETLSILTQLDFNFQGRDIFGTIYEQSLKKEERDNLGLFYTPAEIVHFILDKINYDDSNIIGKKVLDLSCGTGSFLVQATERLIKQLILKNYEPKQIISQICASVYGLEVDSFSIFLAKTNIIFQLLPFIKKIINKKSDFSLPKINIFETNSLNKTGKKSHITYEIKNKTGIFSSGFDYIIGNPPYLETKKMKKQTKTLCRNNFPEIAKGAFDLYIFFIKLGLDLLSPDGKLGYIIPNKFLTAQYAEKLRKYILDNFWISYLVDVSNLEVFHDAMVYPIIMIIEYPSIENNFISQAHIRTTMKNLIHTEFIQLPQRYFRSTERNFFYILPENAIERKILQEILSKQDLLLGDLLRIRWTISFHRAGLREKFVFEQAKGKNPRKFLGGKSYGGNAEIQRYNLSWNGFWIDYNREKARRLKNTFPKIEIFEKEKIIICQNSKRIRSTFDNKGYVCKDIFFVGLRKERAKRLNISYEVILAVLNSKLMSYFYSKIFAGTHVAGNYLHYLPMYLHSLPFPEIKEEEKNKLEKLIREIMQSEKKSSFQRIDTRIDNLIYEIYNLTTDEIEIIEKYVNTVLELKK